MQIFNRALLATRNPQRALRALVSPVISLILTAVVGGCSQNKASDNTITPGVIFQSDAVSGVQILDVDLLAAHVRPVIAATNVVQIRGITSETHAQ